MTVYCVCCREYERGTARARKDKRNRFTGKGKHASCRYIAVASHRLQMTGGWRFTAIFLFGKTLRTSSQAVAVRKDLGGRENCAVAAIVAAMVAYRQAAESVQWSLAEGSGFLSPERSRRRSSIEGNWPLTPAQMTTNRQTHLQAV